MQDSFLDILDSMVVREGYTRSALIREAVYEKLQRMGIAVPKGITYPPARIRKGGKRKT